MQITKTLKEPVAGKTGRSVQLQWNWTHSPGNDSSLQAGSLLNHVGGCSQSNYPHCVYTVAVRAAGLPVWTQGCVDTYSINTSLERFFISLDFLKKKVSWGLEMLFLIEDFHFFLFFYQDTKHRGKQKPSSFYYSTSAMIGWCCSPHKKWLVPVKIVCFLRKLFQKAS